MEDWRADLYRQMREIDRATGEAAGACLPALLRRLHHHEARLARKSFVSKTLLAPYHRWRRRHLAAAVAEARAHVERGRLARLNGLEGRR